jgi:hypothetical protein
MVVAILREAVKPKAIAVVVAIILDGIQRLTKAGPISTEYRTK